MQGLIGKGLLADGVLDGNKVWPITIQTPYSHT